MRTRAALWIPLFGLLGLVAYGFVLLSGDGFDDAKLDEIDGAAHDAESVESAEDRRARPDRGASAERRAADAADEVDDAPRRVVRVRVVDDASGAACPRAELLVCDDEDVDTWSEQRDESNDDFEGGPMPWAGHRALATKGVSLRCDERGEALWSANLDRGEFYIVARASSPARSGFRCIEVHEVEEPPLAGGTRDFVLTVRVRKPHSARVRVLEATRRAAPGVDCRVFLLTREQDRAYLDPNAQYEADPELFDASAFASYRSDAAGELRIDFADRLVEQVLRDDEPEEDERPASIVILPNIPMRQVPSLRIPLEQLNSRVYELVLPPTAALELRFVFADGTPVTSAMRSYVSYEREDAIRHGRLQFDFDSHAQGRKPFGRDSRVRFARLGAAIKLFLDYEFEQQGYGLDEELTFLRRGLNRHTVRLPPTIAGFRASIAGSPERSPPKALQLDCKLDGRRAMSRALEPDPDGLLRFVVSTRSKPQKLELLFWDPTEDEQGAGFVELAPVPTGTETSLRALRLEAVKNIARGVCKDDLGIPLSNCRIRVTRWASSKKLRKRTIPNLETRSRPDGRFELPIPLPAARLEIVAMSNAHVAQSVPYAPSKEHSIALQRHATIEVLMRDVPASVKSVSVQCSKRAGKSISRATRTARVRIRDGRGRAVLHSLAPGPVRVTCVPRRLPGSWHHDVELKPGRSAKIEMRAPQPAKLLLLFESTAGLAVAFPNTARLSNVVEVGPARVELSFLGPEVDVELHKRGYMSVRRRWRAGVHRVVMRKTTPTIVEIQGLAPAILAKLELYAQTTSVSAVTSRGQTRRTPTAKSDIDADGKARLALDASSSIYYVSVRRKGSKRRVHVLRIPPVDRRAHYVLVPRPSRMKRIQDLALGAK